MHQPSPSPALPVAAQYVPVFLKPEMLHLYRQITGLRTFQPVVFCQKREHEETFPFENILRVEKPRTHQLRRLWQKQILGRPITMYRGEARRLEAAITAAQARVLHIYFGHMGVHLLPLLEILRIPAVVSFHGADAQVDLHRPSHRELAERMFQRVRLVLVRSESLARRVETLGCDPAKIRVHRTGLPLGEIPFQPHTLPMDGRWHCVQACRLIAKKGLPTTLRAFALFQAEHSGARLTIAGEGPLLGELEVLAASLGIAASVRFAGFLSQRELGELLGSAHFFLHPSEQGLDGDQEGVPNGLLEAMAYGVPVLATRHGGIPEAVEHGVSGMLVAERDHTALAAEMIALAGDGGRYERIVRAGSDRVREVFDLVRQTGVLEGCYREAIASHQFSGQRLPATAPHRKG